MCLVVLHLTTPKIYISHIKSPKQKVKQTFFHAFCDVNFISSYYCISWPSIFYQIGIQQDWSISKQDYNDVILFAKHYGTLYKKQKSTFMKTVDKLDAVACEVRMYFALNGTKWQNYTCPNNFINYIMINIIS